LEETTSGVWKLFTAVIIHAVAIVFCIGEQLLREMFELGKKAWLMHKENSYVGYIRLRRQ
jgi:hypothetical protein